jgi:Flp pilus assembly protein TadG
MVLFALFLVVLLVLAGSAYDYASVVVDEARLQNAVDAAALAGSNTLASNATMANRVAAAQTATTQYLTANHVDSSNSTIAITPLPYVPPAGTPTPNPPIYDGIGVTVTRDHPTAFWPLVGISQVQLRGSAEAHGARTMLDVMLSLDMTLSEQISGSIDDIANATAAFIRSMNPTAGDPGGARIALARFGGRRNCSGGSWVNTGGTWSYAYSSCTGDDYTLLTGLTDDQGTLLRLADDSGTTTCPTGMLTYACPLKYATTYGTKLPNGVSAAGGPTSGVFQGANSRNNPATTGVAHKVLIVMTDGRNEDLSTAAQEGTWDTQFRNLATALKPGASTTTSLDDVEIYTINFTCPTNPSTGVQTVYPDTTYCMSRLASDGSSGNYGCPSSTLPANRSPVDDLLIAASSSTPGTCDHYFPLKKGDQLPELFVRLAGSISRGQLTQ